MKKIYSIDEARRLARRRLPKMVFNFVDGGAEDENTLRANKRSFDDVTFRPRVLCDVSHRDQTTRVLGVDISVPVMLAPTGLQRLISRKAELSAFRAAAKANTIFVVSTSSSFTIEEIADVAQGPLWFQLYLSRDRDISLSLIERAERCGYKALCLTVDTPTAGKRERDIRYGMTIPPHIGFKGFFDSAWRFRWAFDFIFGKKMTFRNLTGLAENDKIMTIASFVGEKILNPSATWEDLVWLRKIWKRKLIVKGIMSAEDAVRAVDLGVDGILVSNHGGRQLDSVPSTLDVLPEIGKEIGNRAEIYLDGGIRRGRDVVKAKALGAKACFIGRPYLWGLAVGGESGVLNILDIFKEEIDRTLAFIGRPKFSEVDSSSIHFNIP